MFTCPNCKNELLTLKIDNEPLCFYCSKCQVLFPIKDGIPIILSNEARNFAFEYDLIKDIQKKLSVDRPDIFLENTLKLLQSKRGTPQTWEWEEELFWSKSYEAEAMSKIPKNWNNRLWETESLVEELVNRIDLRGKRILSIGAGEGQDFRFLLSKHCDDKTQYIATDISFPALKLNRSRNTHKNSIYIVCSSDYELPLPNHSVDVMCYFGILHHTKNKMMNVAKDKRLLRKDGYIILFEALKRSSLLFYSGFLESETSPHEDRISKESLFDELRPKNGINIVLLIEQRTPMLTLMTHVFNRALLNNKKLYSIILGLDKLIVKTVGRLTDWLQGSEILLLAKET